MNFRLVDIMNIRSYIDVFTLVNSQSGYVTCDEGGAQSVDCTCFRMFAEDFTFGVLTLLEHNVNLMKEYSIGENLKLSVQLPFGNGIPRVVYTHVQPVNQQV